MIPIQMIQKKKKNTVLDTVEEIKEQVEVNLNKNTTIFGQWFKPDYPTKYELRDCKLNAYLFICDSKTLVWKQKRFVLRINNLYYFDKEESKEADGEIKLEDCSITKNIDTNLFIHNFQLIINHPTLKMITIATQTEKQLNDWFTEILSAIETFKKNTSVKGLKSKFESYIDTR